MSNSSDAYEVRIQLMEMLTKMDSHFDLKDLNVVNIKVELDFDTSERFEFVFGLVW